MCVISSRVVQNAYNIGRGHTIRGWRSVTTHTRERSITILTFTNFYKIQITLIMYTAFRGIICQLTDFDPRDGGVEATASPLIYP